MHRLVLALLAASVLATAAAARDDAGAAWPNYEIIMYQDLPAAAYAGLPRLGYSATKIIGQRESFEPERARQGTAPFRAAGLGWYVENIATDFYSAYHRWRPNLPVNWLFLEAQRRFRENPADPTVFHRDPGFDDPAWRRRIADRMAAHAKLHLALAAPGRPLFLSLGDEPGIADLAAQWDFDRAPAALAAFRTWLQREYPTLAALNAQWGTTFPRWEAVEPITTDQAITGRDGSFSAWADFKAFMDESFADALRMGRDAVRGVDPRLPVSIMGGQVPGPGGWNYELLTQAVDLIEGGPAELIGGLNPDTLMLSTSFNANPAEWHMLWRLVLRGHRGVVIWDGENDIVGADGAPGPRGLASVPSFAALRDGIPAQLMASTPERGPVGLLLSQPSYRLRWLLDRRAEARAGGRPWTERGSEAEHLDNDAWRVALFRSIEALSAAGITPRWLTPATLTAEGLAGLRVLVLPHAIALSDAELAAIRAFSAAGGVVVTDAAEPGIFDGRGRRRPAPPLADLPLTRSPALDLGPLLRDAGVTPGFRIETPVPVEGRLWRNGEVQLLALQTARPPAAGQGAAIPVRLHLDAPALQRPIGSAESARRDDRASFSLDPIMPTVLALAPTLLPGLKVERAGQGEAKRVRLSLAGPSPAAIHVLRLELPEGDGPASPDRRWVIRLSPGETRDWAPPAGLTGRLLRVTDILGGDVVQVQWDTSR